jgi:hypothetical protein
MEPSKRLKSEVIYLKNAEKFRELDRKAQEKKARKKAKRKAKPKIRRIL